VFIIALFTSTNSVAKQTFKVVVGLSKPPYVIKEAQAGFELELIRQVLTNIGKTPEFIFIPYGRSEKMLELSDISAVMTVNQQMFPKNDQLSESYINYQNVAISLKNRAIKLRSISDIANYSVASFQLAHKVLGQEFAAAVTDSAIFIQVANQRKQVELLLLGRVDILVMDIKIFLHYLHALGMSEKQNDIQFHYIFPLSPYRVVFKNVDDVARFNQAMHKYKLSTDYKILLKKYNF
tara:strand:- start:25285 stop:25995 length:711 start_codon:yes stop_codon:yes gene_type:complete